AGIGIGILMAPEHTIEIGPKGDVPPRIAGFVAMATKSLLGGAGGRAVSTGKPVHEGETLQVPADGRASLILSDGTEVRLDRGTRVTLGQGTTRTLDLASGRLWSRVTRGDPFLIGAGETRVTVLGTELSVSRSMESTEVLLFSGKARVEAGGAARDLAAGQEVEFAEGRLSDVRKVYSEAIATGWMLELFAYAGRHDRDLAEHMDRLIAETGRRKISHLEEKAIVEELGGICRVPIARFLVSESAGTETEARRKAARVLVRIADASVAAELAAALRDPDAEVRVSAAKAIRRVSEGAACAEPEAFRASCDDGAAAVADAWAKTCAPAAGGD
ncbi:MAG: FecR family protein, partial [Planctomycetes bacterium]|nr:FecR family protein [Planctomycetota bacterium]